MGSKFRRRDRTGRSSTRGRNPPTLEWRTTASSSLHLLEWVLFFQCEIQYTFDVLLDSCYWFLSHSLLSYYGIWYLSSVNIFQNKVFIYRGNECLKLQDIINQLKQEYPMATILQFNNVIDDQKKMGEAQCTAITTC